MKKLLLLSLRLLARDWRSGELTVLALALAIAVASTTTTSMFADRLNRTMILQASEFLAGDLVVTSHFALSDSWLHQAAQLDINFAPIAGFSSVIINGDELLLCGVKAVGSGYPLRGTLKTTQGSIADEQTTMDIPDTGTAWVDQRVLSALGLSLGDSLEVGERILEITRIITYEPDRRASFFSLSPRVMMNYGDLAETGVIQPGSHVHYYFLFSGGAGQISDFKRWLKARLNPSQRILDIYEDRPELGSALSRAERYLGLVSIVVVIIAGVAIAMATRRYSKRHYNMTAILRCLGTQQNEIFYLFAHQLLILGVIASSVGCVLGGLTQEILVWILQDLLPANLVRPSGSSFVFSILTGLVILVGFSLPPILRQRRVSPLRVLRRDLEPLPVSGWLVYGLAFSVIIVLMWRYTQDLNLIFYSISIGMVTIAGLTGITYVLLKASRGLLSYLTLPWRLGMQNVSRHAKSNISQILAFSITLTAMVVILFVRADLLNSWQKQLPDDAPNHFVLNIFPSQWQSFKNQLKTDGIAAQAFYPIVRGRLVKINEVDVYELFPKESRGERAINREFSLTFSESLPPENKVIEGDWWSENPSAQVSVELKMAGRLGIGLNDNLTFNVGNQRFNAEVTSIRKLRWDTMNPNFYMILSQGALKGFPQTYMTSFYLPTSSKSVLTGLVKTFPSVTVLDVDLILKQLKSIVHQVSLAVEYVLLFALMAGFTVLFAAVYTSMDERLYDAGMLRTLGASSRLIRESQMIEFVSLGFMAGLLAAISSELLLWALYRLVFDLSYQMKWEIWVATPLIGSLIIGLFGYWCTRKVVIQSPLEVIQRM